MPAEEMEALDTVANFMVLPLTMPAISVGDISLQTHINAACGGNVTAVHHMYMRQHVPRKDDFPQERTLFLVNVPVDATLSHFQRLFRHCGTIERINFPSLQSGSSGHIIFVDSESVPRALEMRKRNRVWVPAEPKCVGLESMIILINSLKTI